MKSLIDPSGEERLRCFLKVAIDRRRPALSAREVARRCEQYGYKVNESYVAQFLNGSRKSLSFRALKPITKVLGISYFQALLLAGYVAEEDLPSSYQSITTGDGLLDLSDLSPGGREMVKEYFEFVQQRNQA